MSDCIIAGNGPSLKHIDYRRLPDDLPIYRCNQFYLEEKYYLGRRVDVYFTRPVLFFENYFTLQKLQEKGEYQIDKIRTQASVIDRFPYGRDDFSVYFPEVKFLEDILKVLEEFVRFDGKMSFFYNNYPTITILMIAHAIATRGGGAVFILRVWIFTLKGIIPMLLMRRKQI